MTVVRWRLLLGILVPLFCVLPIWTASVPPLSDLLNHVARAHVLSHLDDPVLASAYESAWGPYPNLAYDLLVVPLSRTFDPMLLTKLFVTLTVGLWALGCQLLGYGLLGRLTFRASIASFLIMCQPLLLGYVSFGFGSALALCAVAVLLSADSLSGRRTAAIGTLSLLVAVSHAAAIVSLAIACFAIGTVRAWKLVGQGRLVAARQWALHGVACAPGALYFAHWLVRLADKQADQAFSHPLVSAKTLMLISLGTFVPRWDQLAPLLVIPLLLALVWAARPRFLLAPVAASLLLGAFVFLAPADFGGSYEANGRYALLAWALLFFSVDGEGRLPRLPKLVHAAAMGLFLVFAVRQGLLWHGLSLRAATAEAQAALLLELPPGARLANVAYFADSRRSGRLNELALLHVPALAAISRQADVPTLYAIQGVQPLRHTRPKYDVHRFDAKHEPDVGRLLSEFDALWLCRAPESLMARLRPSGTSLGVAGDCELLLLGPAGVGGR